MLDLFNFQVYTLIDIIPNKQFIPNSSPHIEGCSRLLHVVILNNVEIRALSVLSGRSLISKEASFRSRNFYSKDYNSYNETRFWKKNVAIGNASNVTKT